MVLPIKFEYSYCLTFKTGAAMGGLASHSWRVGPAGHVTVTVTVAWVMSATKRLDSATVGLALLAGTAVSVAEIVSSSLSRAVQVSTVSVEQHGGHEKVSFWILEFQRIEFELYAISFQSNMYLLFGEDILGIHLLSLQTVRCTWISGGIFHRKVVSYSAKHSKIS
jgi:hypothetical protein